MQCEGWTSRQDDRATFILEEQRLRNEKEREEREMRQERVEKVMSVQSVHMLCVV